jgi:glycosyltransferase involved in cell wall biosynthesis
VRHHGESSAGRPRLLVVVPALNEEGSVGLVVKEVGAALPWADVLVVDDGCTDRTAEVARQAGAHVLSLPFNVGVGGAMRAGFRYALAKGYGAVVQIDADGQHDPYEVEHLMSALDEADIVIGARFAGRGEYQARGPRRWAMRLLAAVLSRMAGTPLTDVTSGLRLAGPRAVPLFARHYPAEYLGDTVESLVIAVRAGLRVAQRPVVMRERMAGQASHAPWKAGIYLFRACLALLLAVVRRWPDLRPVPPKGDL